MREPVAGLVLFERLSATQQGPLEKVPALCIEVLSSNRAHDRVTKRFAYAAAGVGELWTVEPTGSVERWTGPGLAQSELLTEWLRLPRSAKVIRSPLLPGFELDVATLRVD